MIDDHDQVWRGDTKGRFCSEPPGADLILAALALNICTLGIPCIYYGSEQQFNGSGGNGSPGHAADQYIREAMFGGAFGAFQSRGRHCFNEHGVVYKELATVAKIRGQELCLKRGRQYLREISGNGVGFGNPVVFGDGMRSVVAWSRVFDGVEVLCAINTDASSERTAWVTVDSEIQSQGVTMKALYPAGNADIGVVDKGDRFAVRLTVAAGGFVMYK
jgi:hypothetical protein